MILLSSSLTSFLQLLGVLIIFAFVLAITYFVTKWIGGFQQMQMSGRQFRVVDSVRIAGNKCVQILKLGDVYLVVAVGKDEVTMLAKLTEDEIGLSEEDFAGILYNITSDRDIVSGGGAGNRFWCHKDICRSGES